MFVTNEETKSANGYKINRLPATHSELKNLTGIIYLFLNITNKKIYIGQYKHTFYKRYSEKRKNWYKYAKNPHFKSALQLFSGENFEIFILEHSVDNPIALDLMEVTYIDMYESDKREFGYNKTIGGNKTTAFSSQIRAVFKARRESYKDQFIKRSIDIHENKFDYSNIIFHGMSYKVENIKCNTCNCIFNQVGTCHVGGHGCRICYQKSRVKKLELKPEEFLSRAAKKYKNRFEYDMSSFVNIHSSIYIYCKECHARFQNTIINHLYNKTSDLGCRTCVSRNSGKKKRLSLIQIDIASNQVIKIYNGITASCKLLKLSEGNLRIHVKNNTPYKGFLWKIE